MSKNSLFDEKNLSWVFSAIISVAFYQFWTNWVKETAQAMGIMEIDFWLLLLFNSLIIYYLDYNKLLRSLSLLFILFSSYNVFVEINDIIGVMFNLNLSYYYLLMLIIIVLVLAIFKPDLFRQQIEKEK